MSGVVASHHLTGRCLRTWQTLGDLERLSFIVLYHFGIITADVVLVQVGRHWRLMKFAPTNIPLQSSTIILRLGVITVARISDHEYSGTYRLK